MEVGSYLNLQRNTIYYTWELTFLVSNFGTERLLLYSLLFGLFQGGLYGRALCDVSARRTVTHLLRSREPKWVNE